MSDTENLPKGWEKFRLDEISEFVIDCPHSTPKWTDTGFIVLRSQNIRNGKLNFSKISFTDEKGYLNRIKRAIPKMGDIVLTREAPMGEVCMIPNNLQCCLGQRMVLIRIIKDTAHNRFILYAFQSSFLKSQIRWNEGTGTTVSNIRIPNINAFEFKLPPIQEQKAIAAILTAFDDKIENLQAQNKTLEKTAQTIFKEWFGKYQIGDELPEGWKVGILGEEFDITIGRTPPRKEREWFSKTPIGKKWISIKDMGNSGMYISKTSEYLTDEAIKKFNIPIIPENTTILSFKMTVGKLTITTEDMLSNEAIAHLKIKAKSSLSSEFIYLLLQNLDFNALGSTSSIVTAINSKIIKNLEILVPDAKLLENFEDVVLSLFNKIKLNQTQIQTLKNTRDTLLPKLMSGAIRVKDFKG